MPNMTNEDTFELMPHKTFIELKRDMELLKTNPFGPRTEEILSKINDLSKSLNLMVEAFKEANGATQNQEVSDFSGLLNPVNQKIDAVIEQNKKIAQGILAVADIAKEALSKTTELEMKISSGAPNQRRDEYNSQNEFDRPLNVPMPPPSASSFGQKQGLQQGSPSMQQPQMSPPPMPNQMQQGQPMQSGFGGQPRDKRLFQF